MRARRVVKEGLAMGWEGGSEGKEGSEGRAGDGMGRRE